MPSDGAGTGHAHDWLPYPSMPVRGTQPARLAALAALFGHAAPAADTARVLELGCAAGGNLIPLAARFPAARFVGVDLSRRHVARGQAAIAALGLGNVALLHGDVAALDPGGRRFDYIICHGLYSWTPPEVQAAILRLCRDALAPDGVATISYNVLPGWRLRMVARDICLHHAGAEPDPARRVAAARAALAELAGAADPAHSYGELLRREAQRLAAMPSAYLLGEFLAPDNAPCTVSEFIDRCARHGLAHLCEGELLAGQPECLAPPLAARLATLAEPGPAAAEQHLDFVTGRPFRRSLLVHGPAASRPWLPDARRLDALHIATPQGWGKADGGSPPRDATGRALDRLATEYPATCRVADLLPDGAPGAATRLREALLRRVLLGTAEVSSLPLAAGRADHARPLAWRVARVDAAQGRPWITSLRHAAVPANPLLHALLPLLDGARERDALREAHAGLRRRFGGPDDFDALLRHLARHAILEPQGPAAPR